MSQPVDWSRPVRTDEEEPRPGRLICSDFDAHDGRTHIILVPGRYGNEHICLARHDGTTCEGYRWVNVPEKHTMYVNVYRSVYQDKLVVGKMCASRDAADQLARNLPDEHIACLKIEFTEGEGLE